MFPENWWMLFVAALIPMIVGSIYYGPLFGKKWMNVNKFTEEYLKEGNMPLILGISYFLSLMLAMMFMGMVIHQANIPGLFADFAADSTQMADMKEFVTKYADTHRTFSHGAFHGVLMAIFFVLPIIAINALFERRGGAYIFIHAGYWLITLALMGGLICSQLDMAIMV